MAITLPPRRIGTRWSRKSKGSDACYARHTRSPPPNRRGDGARGAADRGRGDLRTRPERPRLPIQLFHGMARRQGRILVADRTRLFGGALGSPALRPSYGCAQHDSNFGGAARASEYGRLARLARVYFRGRNGARYRRGRG